MGNTISCFEKGSWDAHPEIVAEYTPIKTQIYQDMTQPLPHYFISSGHNSYLTGNQLTAPSGTSTITACLHAGCRVVELDVYNGTKEPECKHGGTLTRPVTFRACIEAVRDAAFVSSPYPVIVTLENHADAARQVKMAEILRSVLGDKLYVPDPADPMTAYKSPEELRGKVLVRSSVKKHPHEEFLKLVYIKNSKFTGYKEMNAKETVGSASFEESALPKEKPPKRASEHGRSGKGGGSRPASSPPSPLPSPIKRSVPPELPLTPSQQPAQYQHHHHLPQEEAETLWPPQQQEGEIAVQEAQAEAGGAWEGVQGPGQAAGEAAAAYRVHTHARASGSGVAGGACGAHEQLVPRPPPYDAERVSPPGGWGAARTSPNGAGPGPDPGGRTTPQFRKRMYGAPRSTRSSDTGGAAGSGGPGGALPHGSPHPPPTGRTSNPGGGGASTSAYSTPTPPDRTSGGAQPAAPSPPVPLPPPSGVPFTRRPSGGGGPAGPGPVAESSVGGGGPDYAAGISAPRYSGGGGSGGGTAEGGRRSRASPGGGGWAGSDGGAHGHSRHRMKPSSPSPADLHPVPPPHPPPHPPPYASSLAAAAPHPPAAAPASASAHPPPHGHGRLAAAAPAALDLAARPRGAAAAVAVPAGQVDALGKDDADEAAETERAKKLAKEQAALAHQQLPMEDPDSDNVTDASQIVPGSMQELYTYNSRNLMRVYPAAWRVMSDNYNPTAAWIRGASLAALNWQVWAHPMWINEGKFLDNGRCGYVLKPDWMLRPEKEVPARVGRTLRVRVHSAHRHQGGNCFIFKDDIFVRLEIHGMPVDHETQNTKAVQDSGRLVVEKDFNFVVRYPEMAVLLVQLMDEDAGTGGLGNAVANTLGYYALPLSTLREGDFRLAMRHPGTGRVMAFSHTWVKVSMHWVDAPAEGANPMYAAPKA